MKNEILISGLQGWFNFRINLASLLITGPCVAAAVIFSDNLRENSGMIGLLLSYLLDLNSNLIMLLQMQNSFESNLISFERCKTFTTIDVEKDPETKLPLENYSYSWPERGKIEFKNYFTKYRPALPYVLKDVSIKVEGGQKIGVVGRTGSGKSTLFLSILRILEPQAGTIYIDDVDIAKVGLDDLRRKITTIPQVDKDPLLYKGTVKSNLDLLNEYQDNQIWGALEKVRMKNKFEQSGLGTEIKEGGENLSAGERQLLCIARAILKKNKIILIDEATSSIDNVTEEAILGAIHENFKDCTVITIAHRLKTIIESDKVLFMENGQVLEFDTTKALLDNPESHFYHLWHEYQEAKAKNAKKLSDTKEILVSRRISRKTVHRTCFGQTLVSLKKKYPIFNFNGDSITLQSSESKNPEKYDILIGNITKKIKVHNWKPLERLKLDIRTFVPLYEKNKEIFETLGSNISRNFARIKELKLDFYDTALTDQELEMLANAIVKYPINFEGLNLNLVGQITDEGIKNFGRITGHHLSNLKELTIDLRCCPKLTDTGLQALGFKLLKNMNILNKLNLYFKWVFITPQGVEALTHQINRNLPQLKSLTLCFKVCPKITREDLERLRPKLSFISELNLIR